MFSLFRKRTEMPKKEKPVRKGPKYIYKPNENAMSFRVEYREGLGYVYPGWSKKLLFKIEEDKILSAADESIKYIIIGRDVYDAAGEQILLRISGERLLSPNGKELLYEMRDSITVQGTL